jgi:hypothetical protein
VAGCRALVYPDHVGHGGGRDDATDDHVRVRRGTEPESRARIDLTGLPANQETTTCKTNRRDPPQVEEIMTGGAVVAGRDLHVGNHVGHRRVRGGHPAEVFEQRRGDRMGGPQIPEGPAEENTVGVATGRVAGIDLPPLGRIAGEVVDLEPCPARPWDRHGRQMIAVVVPGVGVRPDLAHECARIRGGEQQRSLHRELAMPGE